MSDTKSKPNVGDIYTQGRKRFIVTKVKGNIIYLVEIDSEDKKISSEQSYMWPDDFSDFEKAHSRKEESPRTNKTDSANFSFAFDPKTGEIIVTWPDGIKTERLQSIKGEKGDSVFEEWCHKLGLKPDANNWQTFLKSLRGNDGQFVRGADAPTLYEEWKGRQPKDSDTSYTAFFNEIKGEKGKDGYEGKDGMSAYEFWKSKQPKDADTSETAFWKSLKGDTGENGPQGHNGIDGDTWVPFFSNDGHELYFKNQKGEILGPFDVVGATGKTGPQGPRGESAYQIWLNEGNKGDFHDFLLWIAKQAQKGDNGKDGDTFRPHIEKGGHLFFISTKTGERIDGGWVKGEKGDQGETGLNGHNVTHKYGYKEIYDWTCPVQEINPHLIASSDDLASGGSAEKHMRETLNRIKNIRKQGEKKENRGGPLQEFFWWCSGADTRLLRMCPAEHSKYMGIGTVIFFTALMAMFSSYIAISFVFGTQGWNLTGCVAFAVAWGAMIFCLDRFITNTMYSDGKVTISWLELRSALPRILISIFLGIVISAPLELKIFEKEIDTQIVLEKERFVNSNVKSTEDEIRRLSHANDSIRIVIDERKDNESNNKTVETRLDKEKELFANREDQINNRYPYPRMPWGTRDENPSGWSSYDQKCEEVDKKRERDLAKAQAQHDSICNVLNSQSNDTVSTAGLENLLSSNDNKIQVAQSQLIAKKDSLARAFDRSDGLGRRLAALHAIAYQEDKEEGYKAWPWVKEWWWCVSLGIFLLLVLVSAPFLKNVVKGNKDGKSTTVKDPNFKGALVLYPWFAVTALVCGYFTNTLFNAVPYYIFTAVGMIMMLFILIDVSPVFYKMMLADGQYEQYLHKEKSITQDLVRLNFAKSIAKVNESEIGRLAPLIFSKPFEKIKEILQGSKKKDSLEWTMDEEDNNIRIASQAIRESNEDVFATVLSMKKAIIEASYQAWYRDMRDAIIGMHKPGGPNGGNAPADDVPNNPNDPSARARRETGHHTSDDEPFNEENYYGGRTGTSPDYDASSDDPHPETPEDFLNEEDSHMHNHTDEDADDTDFDEQDDDDSLDDETSPSSDDDNSEETDDEDEPSSETISNDENTHPDADVESEVSDDDDDDDDTINPK